jgi:hypothetical protein
MSSNLSVVNFTIGGTLTVSGKITLGETLLSSSSMDIQGLSTTSLNVTGTSTFNNSLPTSTQNPVSNAELTTKFYVDTEDSIQKTYIDQQDISLNNRITSTDSAQKTYIDQQDISLNNRITSTDLAQKTYIDQQDISLNNRITSTDLDQKTYIDTQISNIQVKPLFYVYIGTTVTQTVANNAMTKVGYSSVLYNNLNKYLIGDDIFGASSYGGYYQFNATVCLPNINSGYIAIFKNGVEFSRGTSFSSTSISPDTMLTISTVMFLNGKIIDNQQDFCDIRVICSPSTVISGSQSKTFFTGHFIQS